MGFLADLILIAIIACTEPKNISEFHQDYENPA